MNSNETETVEEKQKEKKNPTHCEGITVMVDKYEAGVQLNLWGWGLGGSGPGRVGARQWPPIGASI